jgi:hypothetical protein
MKRRNLDVTRASRACSSTLHHQVCDQTGDRRIALRVRSSNALPVTIFVLTRLDRYDATMISAPAQHNRKDDVRRAIRVYIALETPSFPALPSNTRRYVTQPRSDAKQRIAQA